MKQKIGFDGVTGDFLEKMAQIIHVHMKLVRQQCEVQIPGAIGFDEHLNLYDRFIPVVVSSDDGSASPGADNAPDTQHQ